MQLDEPVGAGNPRAQVVGAEHAGHAADQLVHALADLGGQLLVHQHGDRFAGDVQRTPQDVQRDAEAEQRVQPVPAVTGEDQRDENAGVQQHVRAVVQRVGADRGGAGGFHHLALQGQQGGGQHQRQNHHGDTQTGRGERFGVLQAAHCLGGDQQGADRDEQRLGEAGQRLRLAVAIAVVVVRRADRVMHRQQIEE
ncbi:hypothetical protein D3C78_1435150 [compost metagenome]